MRLKPFCLIGSALLLACAGSVPPLPAIIPGSEGVFDVQGDPSVPRGAAWTFKGVIDGTRYDLTGVLYKPAGDGPFPAVVLSHGYDGNAAFLAARIAPVMV